ncbi:DUF1328 domain-containing protein [Olleya aquimaris]|uniref:DUF1328 domain-containing protein n=1 Tax=Olleya sediminilitoris TaxID=2795739 RepID=A0ABS1WPE9_9FLAO|nr:MULTISPECIES: DUF1328 family protein [Olleya]AXO79920.1 DUF1328 domain-containing protein [Olleya aquimaris]MBL7561009.1 DUF1328 domain-containing protein [Olleya sediminilitoris]
MRWTIFFITFAFISAVLGFGHIAGNLAIIAKLCFFIFIALFLARLYKTINEY